MRLPQTFPSLSSTRRAVEQTVEGTADTVEDAGTVNEDRGFGFAFGETTSGGLGAPTA